MDKLYEKISIICSRTLLDFIQFVKDILELYLILQRNNFM